MGRLLRAAPILWATLALGTAGSLALPGTALAGGPGKGTIAPPGNSGVSQYVEDVPTAQGGKPTNSIVIGTHGGGSGSGGTGSGGSGPSGGAGGGGSTGGGSGTSGGGAAGGGAGSTVNATATLSPAVTRKLDRSGQAGRSAVALAQATAPVLTRRRPVVPRPVVAASAAVIKSLEGSAGGGGMGSFLPIFLIATLVLVSVAGLLSRRRAT